MFTLEIYFLCENENDNNKMVDDVRETILRAFSFVDSIERKSKMRKCTEFTIIAIIVTASCVCVLFI